MSTDSLAVATGEEAPPIHDGVIGEMAPRNNRYATTPTGLAHPNRWGTACPGRPRSPTDPENLSRRAAQGKVSYSPGAEGILEVTASAVSAVSRGSGEVVVRAPPGLVVRGELRGHLIVPLIFREVHDPGNPHSAARHAPGGQSAGKGPPPVHESVALAGAREASRAEREDHGPAVRAAGSGAPEHHARVPYVADLSVPLAGAYRAEIEIVGPHSLVCHCDTSSELWARFDVGVASVEDHPFADEERLPVCAGAAAARAAASGVYHRVACGEDTGGSAEAPRGAVPVRPGGSEHACGTHLEDDWMWHPRSCRLRIFDAASARRCLAGKHVVIAGDSTNRQIAADLDALLRGVRTPPKEKSRAVVGADGKEINLAYGLKANRWTVGGADITYINEWLGEGDPRRVESYLRADRSKPSAADHVFFNIGAHYVARGDLIYEYADDVAKYAKALREVFPAPRKGKLPPSSATLTWRGTYASENQKRSCVTAARVDYMNAVASEIMAKHAIHDIDVTSLSMRRPECSDGIHRHLCGTSRLVTQTWLNIICPVEDDVKGDLT